MRYVVEFSVCLHWCVVSIAIKESGEDTRVVFIRVCETCDNTVPQKNRALAMNVVIAALRVMLPRDREAQPCCCHAEAHQNHPRQTGGVDQGSSAV